MFYRTERWRVFSGLAPRVVFLWCLLPAATVVAQTASPAGTNVVVEKITVTATGAERKVSEVPVTVSVVTAEEIEDSQLDSVADLVRRLPGVSISRTGGDGGATSFFIRGAESDQVLALFDGVRLNSPYFAGYDWSTLPLAGVERVEVARGPFSALWGSDAVGGVVNVIPGRGGSGRRIRLLGEAGDDDWQRFEGTFGWTGESFDALVSSYDREGRGELENSDFSNRQLLLDGGFAFGSGQRIAVLYQDLDAELGIPFSSPGNLTPNRRQDSQQELAALPMTFQPSASWGLEFTPSIVEREFTFRAPDDAFGFTFSERQSETTQVRAASRHDLGESRHELSVGGEWREDEVDDESTFGVNLVGAKIETKGLFLQDLWRASDRLTVVAGVRVDDTDEWGSEVSPRVSLGLRASDLIEFRASYGEAFRQPSVGELFFPFSGNPTLEPERSQSAEIGLGLSPGRHRIDAALFATDTEDLIDFDFVTFTLANLEEVELRGAEVSWGVPFSSALRSVLQLTWLDTEDQDGLELLRRPKFSSSWTLSGSLGRKLRGDLSVVYVGERPDVDATTFARTETGSYVTGNLAASYRMVGDLELTLRVQNVADRDYEEVNGYPAPGRRVIGGLRLSF